MNFVRLQAKELEEEEEEPEDEVDDGLPDAYTCELCPFQDDEKCVLERHLKYHRRVNDHVYKHVAGLESSATDTDGESSSSTPSTTMKRKSKRRHGDVVECDECDFRGKLDEVFPSFVIEILKAVHAFITAILTENNSWTCLS
jgi:hypothetical protein